MRKVALFSMPVTGSPLQPSLQLGILSSLLQRAGIPVRCHSLHLEVLAELTRRGLDRLYLRHAYSSGMLLPEALFSDQGGDEPGPHLSRLAARTLGPKAPAEIAVLRRNLREILDGIAAGLDLSDCGVAGFTLTFPQICASMAMARRLKDRWPDLRILIGGSGAQVHAASAPAFLEAWPQLDAALVGEAEGPLVPLVQALLAGQPPQGIPGAVWRGPRGVEASPPAPRTRPLDEPVLPDFTEFFERVAGGPLEGLPRVLPLEVGRGCSWGDHQTCSFCALGHHGTYRRRGLEDVVEELRQQSARYGVTRFEVVDDLVDPPTLSRLAALLEDMPPGFAIDYMCARATTSPKQLQECAKAGVRGLFCGIESFSDPALALLGKGTTAVHNVAFLRSCHELGLHVGYNLLVDLPGSHPEDVKKHADLVGRLRHLPPPLLAVPVQVLRWSPYHEHPEAHGLAELRPARLYGEIYPPGADLPRLAFVFEASRPGDPRRKPWERRLRQAVDAWRKAWEGRPPRLEWRSQGAKSEILDTRGWWTRRHRLGEVETALYRALMERPLKAERLRASAPADWDEARVRRFLGWLDVRGLVVRSGELWLALALTAAPEGGGRSPFLRRDLLAPRPGERAGLHA